MLTIGASHRTADSSVLGDLSRAADALHSRLSLGSGGSGLPFREVAILATCARVELYVAPEDSREDDAASLLSREVFGVSPGSGQDGVPYRLQGAAAVRHLCRVAAGLESFVVGEHEIAGQVSRAFREAVRVQGGPSVLEGAAAVARRASRRVRAETDVGRYPASVSSVAVDIARERLGPLTGRRALVVGAGRAGLLVARALSSSGVSGVTVVNRSLERAVSVAVEVGGEAADLDRLPELLAGVDVVVSATGADGIVVDAASARAAVADRDRRGPPLLIFDLALPGDVHPEVGLLEGIELLTLEDVKSRARRSISLRRDEVGAASQVVDEVVEDFLRKQDTPDMEGLIGELRRSIEAVRSAEVDRWLAARSSAAPPSRQELDYLTRSIVNKVLHDPMRRLREAPEGSSRSRLMVRAARELLPLERGPDPLGSGG